MANITINITNGTAPYLVETIPDCGTSWNFGSAGVKVLHDVPAGEYAVRVTDAKGCVVTIGGVIIEGCSQYGYLYNWFAVSDARNIAANGWHVPSKIEFETLQTYLGGSSVAGGHLKETGYVYWDLPNTDADNSSGFNARGSGARNYLGTYTNLKKGGNYWTTTAASSINGYYFNIGYNSAIGQITNNINTYGFSIHLIKDDSTLDTYTGNDGKEYQTVKIGNQVWLAENLAETLYRDLSDIPYVYGDSEWSALSSGARCAYNNDCNNVGCNEVCPTTTTTTPSP